MRRGRSDRGRGPYRGAEEREVLRVKKDRVRRKRGLATDGGTAERVAGAWKEGPNWARQRQPEKLIKKRARKCTLTVHRMRNGKVAKGVEIEQTENSPWARGTSWKSEKAKARTKDLRNQRNLRKRQK